MMNGYWSSDDDEYDDFDFGYSDPLIIKKNAEPPLPEIKNQEFKEKFDSILEESKLIKLFLDAVEDADLETLGRLVLLGVDVDGSAPNEWTPLMKACVMGKFEVVQFLLENGSNPNKQKELFTPLMACCTHTLVPQDLKLNCVRILLEHGAEVNAKDKHRTTALMYATGSGYCDIVTELLRTPGIDVNIQDREGWTALFYAVNHSNTMLVEKLVVAGTDLTLKDRCERTVINLALDKELKEVAKILGYVEEEHPKPQSREKELSCRFLDELPDSDGQGGFPSDAQTILQAFNQYKVKNISLPDLLNATDSDLYEVGVKLQPDRLRILCKGIHRFHMEPWKKTSMLQLVDDVPLSLEDAIAITGSVAKHLTVINATLRYLSTRISTRKNKTQNKAIHKDTVIVLIDAFTVAKKLNELLPKILQFAQEIEPEIEPDRICPQVKKSYRQMAKKLFYFALGAGAAAALLIRYHGTNHYSKVVVVSSWPFVRMN